ncbi:glucose-6-phosphate exchanger SLC37A2-like isoform X2 [Saccostrea echinata]|uniref:glucose-6-phosphate exchanger SLC37A2-like isoform X2 n=1 Tax=Saccostrea echinata TaxID=191078 RepID=UPI002A7FD2F7|nr:glucose-6-phosphate exchanger SLC37A2-like isoform X2 [Saccostrea echinata]
MTVIPIGIRLLPSLGGPNSVRTVRYKIFILIFTFLCYTSYHLSRKPISVVKSVLNRNCSVSLDHEDVFNISSHGNNTKWCDWKPFDKDNANSLLGSLDLAYLFAYAVGMFLSGHIAERMNLRIFLSMGMIGSGIMTAMFGMGYFWNIHTIAFYIGVQVIGGLLQSSGWPSVVTCVGNWYGKGKRGLIMGIWNSHTSVGNILGSLIAGIFVNTVWGWSFIVPGIIIASLGVLVFLFMVPTPDEVGCDLPDQSTSTSTKIQHYAEDVSEKSDLNGESYMEYGSTNSQTSLVSLDKKEKPISLFRALRIPGVIEFSLCLFFAKLVSYTFLYWLPKYIHVKANYDPEKAADISTLFDVGGIFGGIMAGLVSDFTGMRAATCVIMLVISAPVLYIYNLYGSISLAHSIGLSMLCGFFVNGPYALITTAVSADLGTHKVLQGNAKALSTVTAIIDGTGSIGAAVGPLLAGVIESSGWNNVFYMLIASDVMALLLLLRLFYKEMVVHFGRGTAVS